MADPFQVYRTVRHLKGEQIYGQILLRVQRAFEKPNRKIIPVRYPGCRWNPQIAFVAPVAPDHAGGKVPSGVTRFLNQSQAVGFPPDWNGDRLSKLWRYNLHYHDYIWELPFDQARVLALDWVERHPPGRNRDGWEPYPISLRLVNWCAYFFGNYRSNLEASPELLQSVWGSVYRQGVFLKRQLETHLLGNHYLENAVALCMLGSCFDGPVAAGWLRKGLDILRDQLPEQVLSDGGHFERSPMYHSRVVWCLLTLFNTGVAELVAIVREPLEKALQALAVICHPDGQIALLNDSAFGIYARPRTLLDYGERLLGKSINTSCGPFSLPDSGYYGARTPEGHYVICDYAPIGPDYQPGHAHGDIFSFELTYSGHRVVVDSGVFDYEVSETRAYCRSTRAHNTVTINDQDQCEFWGAFRVARRGRPHDVHWEAQPEGFRIEGWHDGYCHIPGKPIHKRQTIWHDSGLLLLQDEVKSNRPVAVTARIHLHPDCTVVRQDRSGVELGTPAGPVTVRFSGTGELNVEDGYYCPEFGVKLANKVLAWSARGALIQFDCCVAPAKCAESSGYEFTGKTQSPPVCGTK